MDPKAAVSFKINGVAHSVRSEDLDTVHMSLSEYLREKALLKGTKVGCNQGGCGACTVVVDRPGFTQVQQRGAPEAVNCQGTTTHTITVNACLTPILSMEGASVTTVEGVGDVKQPHVVQTRLSRLHGSQCGFCTPGMVMSIYGLLKQKSEPSSVEVEGAIEGNLCRCTGYRPILDTAKSFANDIEDTIPSTDVVYPPLRGTGGADEARGPILERKKSNVLDDASRFPKLSANGKERMVSTTRKTIEQVEKEVPYYPEQFEKATESTKPPKRVHSFASLPLDASSSTSAAVAGGGGGVGNNAPVAAAGPISTESGGILLAKVSPIYGKDGSCWLAPKSLAQLHDAMASFPDAKLVGGNYGYKSILDQRTKPVMEQSAAGGTGVASLAPAKVDVPAPGAVYSTTSIVSSTAEKMLATTAKPLIWMQQIKELATITYEETEGNLHVGAAITMSQVLVKIRTLLMSTITKSKNIWFKNALEELFEAITSIGSPQGRNTSTLVGHVLTRPAGDAIPLLAAMKAEVVISNPNREARRVPVKDMCAASGCLMPGDVVTEVKIPIPTAERYVGTCKAALRNKLSSGSVCVGISFRIVSREGAYFAEDVDLFCCGASYFLLSLQEASRGIHGTSLNKHFSNALHKASQSLLMTIRNEMHVPPDGRQPYRIAVARGLLYRLFHKARVLCFPQDAQKLLMEDSGMLRGSQVSEVKTSYGTQSWEVTTGNIHTGLPGMEHDVREETTQLHRTPVGDPKMIMSGLEQATGQAVFVDDVPTPAGCLHAALVKSTIAKGKIIRIDHKVASQVAGFVAFFDYGDVPVKTLQRSIKEHAFADNEVSYVGDVIGLCVATSQMVADKCAKLVDVKYEVQQPIFTIEEAIKAKSFIPYGNEIIDGDVEGAFNNPKHTVIRGVMHTGGQEHYYMEPHALLVVPGENEDIEITSMTQCVTKSQALVASTLGVPISKVNVKVRRIGGAFGGKEVRTTYTSATLAVAAAKLKRPVRWLLNREEDMRITGGRHPIRSEWAVAFNKDDKRIQGIEVKLYVNGGCTDSATSEVTNRALMHITNAYKIPAVKVNAQLCCTNIVSNTAYRGFGAPQAMLIMETMMEAVAKNLDLPVESLQRSHLIKLSERLHYGQNLAHCRLSEMWSRVMESSSFAARSMEVEKFNGSSRWMKKGIAVTPTLYGINFPVRHLNYGAAFVTVYADGSCCLSHSAVEMGQGVNTKCCQVAARALGIPTTQVNVTETSSEKIPNAPPTAASMGADLACMAVLDACEQIAARLRPIAQNHPPGTSFAVIASAAIKQRISLAAEGSYRTAKGAEYDWKMVTDDNSKRGEMFNYHTFGIGVSEVELDVLTGMFRCVRTDLLMDCGDTLNAAIDIGQVEGAFVQGLGWLTMEELMYGDASHPELPQNGELWNTGPSGYKIPQAADVPLDFRCELLSGAPNPFAVHGSKAVGEPPLFLSASVFAAIKKAIYAARWDEGMPEFHLLDAPLTAERIRMACHDAHTLGTFPGDHYKAPGSF